MKNPSIVTLQSWQHNTTSRNLNKVHINSLHNIKHVGKCNILIRELFWCVSASYLITFKTAGLPGSVLNM
jgi:hypothetical protein